jgi:TatD DNase family protein
MAVYRLVDTHAHLDEIESLEPVLEAARQAGVIAIVAVGSDIESNRKVLRLAGRYQNFVYPALGWHPWYIREADIERSLEFICAHISEAVAVGEIGLDYHKKVREGADKDLQKRVFREILQIAREHGRPALVHSRYAWKDAFDLVADSGLEKAVFHYYTGISRVRRDIIARGYYISATPAVAYREEHRRAVKEVPPERLLLETDAPVVYRPGTGFEYESKPADVLRSLRGAAALRGVGEDELAAITTANARRLFGIG